ncbi:MAG: NAD(P)-dependent glycerol-3-phosphate dehydrogenase [Planctomycetes bacterium]|nr:NAD(P)-dependent glycerol-3-phosphate dehydrogenase [Planctomycetota bacterium]
MAENVLIIGAGGWGTAMAVLLARKGLAVTLWARRAEFANELRRTRENLPFLPGIGIPANVAIVGPELPDFSEFVCCFAAVPTRYLREVFSKIGKAYPATLPLVSLTKGIEQETLLFPTQILKQCTGAKNVLSLSGPSHGEEVAQGLPTSVVVAGDGFGKELQKLVSTPTFRAYLTDDLIGVELGGAAKNVVAIAAGGLEGLHLGDNAKAALLARGIAEIARLGVKMGAQERTFFGLSGVGDLYTTCASPYGRNRGFGVRIGRGEKPADVIASMEMEVEGYNTAKALVALARKHGIEMPIAEQVERVLYHGADPHKALLDLMNRTLKAE